MKSGTYVREKKPGEVIADFGSVREKDTHQEGTL
jgi:hypothetical protein